MFQIKPDIRSLTYEELNNYIINNDIPKFRTSQIFKWIHSGVESFGEMTNIPKNLQIKLAEDFEIYTVAIHRKLVSKLDGTVKFVFKLFDDNFIETVVMKYKHGYSICVSCQVGCRMGCEFCQSSKSGLIRNLFPGEILGQVLKSQRELGIRISNIVMMGIGEPLDNYDNTLKFLKIVNSKQGINIGYRHISLSTCGLVDKIKKLANENFPITLSISLHSAFDNKRSSMMPINKRYNIDEIISACKYYQSITGRRICFEYSLIDGVNNTEADCEKLVKILSGIMYHINLIPINKIENGIYFPPDINKINKFNKKLLAMGASSTIRRTLGSDISASCGQLRSKYEKERGDQH